MAALRSGSTGCCGFTFYKSGSICRTPAWKMRCMTAPRCAASSISIPRPGPSGIDRNPSVGLTTSAFVQNRFDFGRWTLTPGVRFEQQVDRQREQQQRHEFERRNVDHDQPTARRQPFDRPPRGTPCHRPKARQPPLAGTGPHPRAYHAIDRSASRSLGPRFLLQGPQCLFKFCKGVEIKHCRKPLRERL